MIEKKTNNKKLWNIHETKIPDSLIALFTASSSSSSWYFLSHVGLGSPFTTSLYKRHLADEDLSIPEWSSRNKRNRRKINAWNSSDSLNGYSCSPLIFIRFTIPWSVEIFYSNTMECNHRGQGEGKWGEKRTILSYFIFFFFLIKVFLKEVLGLLAKHFKLRRDCM